MVGLTVKPTPVGKDVQELLIITNNYTVTGCSVLSLTFAPSYFL